MRCPTRSGPYQCDLHEGHDGECETRQEARDWVGPALAQTHVHDTIAAVESVNAKRLRSLEKELRSARVMAGLPHIVSPLKP